LDVGALGEKNRLCTMSPTPDWFPAPAKTLSSQTTHTMVRETRFQFSPIEIATTGWMFKT